MALALAGCLASAVPAFADAPARVVSMNLCTDQLAMMLAAPGQLVSVSHLATEVVVVQRTANQRIHLGMVDPHGRYCGLGSECLGKAKLHDCG